MKGETNDVHDRKIWYPFKHDCTSLKSGKRLNASYEYLLASSRHCSSHWPITCRNWSLLTEYQWWGRGGKSFASARYFGHQEFDAIIMQTAPTTKAVMPKMPDWFIIMSLGCCMIHKEATLTLYCVRAVFYHIKEEKKRKQISHNITSCHIHIYMPSMWQPVRVRDSQSTTQCTNNTSMAQHGCMIYNVSWKLLRCLECDLMWHLSPTTLWHACMYLSNSYHILWHDNYKVYLRF